MRPKTLVTTLLLSQALNNSCNYYTQCVPKVPELLSQELYSQCHLRDKCHIIFVEPYFISHISFIEFPLVVVLPKSKRWQYLLEVRREIAMEQRASIKFCIKLGKTFTKTLEMLRKPYGDRLLSQTAVDEWFKKFKEGRKSLDDDERSGRLASSRMDESVEKIRELSTKWRFEATEGLCAIRSTQFELRLTSASLCTIFWHQNLSKSLTILRDHQFFHRVTTFCSADSKCS